MKKYFLAFFIIISCTKVDCNKIISFYRNEELQIIVEEMPMFGSAIYFEIKGRTIKDSTFTFKTEDRIYCQYYKFLKNGDTIIKRQGQTIFSIHKKDTILNIPFECDGQIFR